MKKVINFFFGFNPVEIAIIIEQINVFREQCQNEYNTLVEILDDYHVLYFIDAEPNPNWPNINNYDVKYPNKIPDITMSELLELVEQNLSVDLMLEKFQIIKQKHSNLNTENDKENYN